ncbi:hypothetical protein HYPSUDRAFT_915661 [Hypholoma sublateritium FD-334 SS-4]|uniref:F-box domain-containing protein n=1 Tax=Hypholoma sublateritium (strain FD-334 SS-4) TaxID=945553 RepID=A0A0D2KVS6_HYPSF|nr:hypothetical protein HYPSUDRAFT_915661 [Hypholoma sublateritium FD-334 SS-4]
MSSTLQDITIFATTTKLKTLFPLPVVNLPCLTSLRVIIKCRKDPSEDESDLRDIQLAIASFANSVRHTLGSLSVRCPPGHDLSLFYEALGDFRNLSSIDIDLTAELTSMPGGILHMQSIQFLLRHQETIEHITVSASKLLVIKQSTGGKYWFPRLKSFSLGSNVLTVCSEQTQAFLRDHTYTLQCLELVGPISPLELDELLTALSGESRRSVLTKLSISIYRLDLNLMLKLANCLPSLKTLKLCIMRVANGTSFAFTPGQFFPLRLPPHTDVHEFVTEVMACHELKTWQLRDIMISRPSCCAHLTLWHLMRFFAECIPTISSFAETGTTDIPDPSNPTPRHDTPRCAGGSFECFYGSDGLDAGPLSSFT